MRQRLHIAVLDEELPYPLTSGKRIRTFNLLRRLADRHRITYVCHRNADPAEAEATAEPICEAGMTPLVVDRSVPKKSGLGFYARLAGNLLSPLPYSVATHTSRQLRQAVERLQASDPPDLWHCEWTPYAQTLRELGTRNSELGTRNLSCAPRWLVMAHNVESLIWQRYAETEPHPLKRWYVRRQWRKFERFERWAYSAATRTVAVSPEDAALVRNHFGAARVDVVDNGVDTEYFHPRNAQRDPFRILFLGSLDWRPNLDGVRLLLDNIFPQVRAQEPRARLVVVGRNPPEWLRQLTAQRAGIELHANVADVRPFLWQAGVLAVPLRIGGGSRLKILEALATGLPVVSTRIGAEGLALEADRHIVVADGPEAISEALLRAMSDPAPMRAMAECGRERVLECYDWDALAERLEEVWLACAAHAPEVMAQTLA
jgi:glycosyltransferase involved in cell wall biosynthesis